MFKCFYPDEYLDSTYSINFDRLRAEGYRGVLFDVDNTLVPHGAPADARAIHLFAHLRELGMEACLISNNQRPRVESFAGAVGAYFIENAHKPGVKNYKKAMELIGCTEKNALFVGDQLFTDVYGAKRAGAAQDNGRPFVQKCFYCGVTNSTASASDDCDLIF